MARALMLGILGIYSWFKIGSLHFYALSLWIEGLVWGLARFLSFSPRHAQWLSLAASFSALMALIEWGGWSHSLLRVFLISCFRTILRLRGAKGAKAFPLMLTLVVDFAISGTKAIDEGSILFYLLVTLIHVSPLGTPWWKISLQISVLFQSLSLFQNHMLSVVTPALGLVVFPWMVGIGFLFPTLKEKTMQLTLWVFDHLPSMVMVSSEALIGAAVAAIVMVLLPKKKSFLLIACIVLVWMRIHFNPQPPTRVIQWSVGQGDSALMERERNRVMVDVGSARGNFERDWLRRLAHAGADHIHEIVLTHLDEDHAGALMRILPLVAVDCIVTHKRHWSSEKGRRLREWIQLYFPKIRTASKPCTSLIQIHWFSTTSKRAKGNALMAGVRFEMDSNRAYYALGDGDQSQELHYFSRLEKDIRSHRIRVWKVSHHGSRYSSSPEFLRLMSPSECWISVGVKNGYHHPHPFTLHRLNDFCRKVWRTDIHGDLIFSNARIDQPMGRF